MGPPLPHLPRKILKTNSKRKILCKILHPKGLDVKIFIRKELRETFGPARREPGEKTVNPLQAQLSLTTHNDYWPLATGH